VVRHPLRTTWLSIAKLSCLVATDPEQAEAELIQLTYSRAEIRAVNPPRSNFAKPEIRVPPAQMSLPEQYFSSHSRNGLPASSAGSGSWDASGSDRASNQPLPYPDDPVAHPIPLVTGKELNASLADTI